MDTFKPILITLVIILPIIIGIICVFYHIYRSGHPDRVRFNICRTFLWGMGLVVMANVIAVIIFWEKGDSYTAVQALKPLLYYGGIIGILTNQMQRYRKRFEDNDDTQ
jgi:hypothetical protein